MKRNILTALILAIVATPVAWAVYELNFGIWFDINRTYFPQLREYINRISPSIFRLTWVASFSTISLIYLLVRAWRKKA